MDPIKVPLDGVLDLHTFNPKELRELLSDYLSVCREKGIMSVRIIHGKGSGVQKARVRSLLSKNIMVLNFKDAPEQWGGWGATEVTLR
jgi:DNA-nicking Smr family endonuclease